MSIANDQYLSPAVQQKIKDLTAQATSKKISWQDANTQANQLRTREGSAYTADVHGADVYNPSQTQSFQLSLENSGWPDYQKMVQQQTQAKVDQAVKAYQDQIEQTNTDSAELARQAYIAKMQSQKNLPQQLSAAGYSGGMADTQKLQLETGYQNNLNDIENQRASTVKQLQSAITNAQLSGDMEAASQLSTQLATMQNQWDSNKQNLAAQNASNYFNQQSLDQNAKETALSKVTGMLQLGVMPDSTTLATAGISSTQAAALMSAYRSKSTASTTGTKSTSGAKSSGSGSSLTAAQAQSAVKSGTYTNTTLSAYDDYYGDGAFLSYLKGTNSQVSNMINNISGLSDARKLASIKEYYDAGYYNSSVYSYLLDYFGLA